MGLLVVSAMSLFAFTALVLSAFGDDGLFKIRLRERDRLALERRVESIERENEALRRQLLEMKQGRIPYELAAREKLGLVKPGEVVYDFRSDPLAARR
jgi:cell division protein FtsB